ncbi:hypothetical protein [Aeromonas veronii]
MNKILSADGVTPLRQQSVYTAGGARVRWPDGGLEPSQQGGKTPPCCQC